jgi:hypothetical protein
MDTELLEAFDDLLQALSEGQTRGKRPTFSSRTPILLRDISDAEKHVQFKNDALAQARAVRQKNARAAQRRKAHTKGINKTA